MITFSRVPIIGGKELDLHHLFVEVTSRGGLEKVEMNLSMTKDFILRDL